MKRSFWFLASFRLSYPACGTGMRLRQSLAKTQKSSLRPATSFLETLRGPGPAGKRLAERPKGDKAKVKLVRQLPRICCVKSHNHPNVSIVMTGIYTVLA
jgi:hypothetical protein